MHRHAPTALVALVATALLTAGSPLPPGSDARILFQGSDPQNIENDSLFVADAEGENRHELLTAVEGDLLHPDWSPDGRRIVFVVDGQSIRIASAAGANPTTLVSCSVRCSGLDFPAWSPDGRSIAYTRYVEPGPAGPPASSVIVIRDLRSGRDRVVARSDPGQLLDTARWSSGGGRLVIGIDRFDANGFETGSAIATVDVRRAVLHRLTPFALYAYAPDWRPRSDEIVFSRETLRYSSDPPDGPLDLYGIRADGSHLRRITRLQGERVLFQPASAPDGRTIVATLDEPGGRRGARIDPATGAVTRLTHGEGMTHLKQRP